MVAWERCTGVLLVAGLLTAACGDDGGGRATDSLSTTAPPGSSTTASTDAAAGADGIRVPADAAVFVVNAWVAGERSTAARHADSGAVDALFAIDPPRPDAVEFGSCDTADLENHDCFFVIDGEVIVLGIHALRVTSVHADAG